MESFDRVLYVPEWINEIKRDSKNEWLVHCPACDGMVEKWREIEEEAQAENVQDFII